MLAVQDTAYVLRPLRHRDPGLIAPRAEPTADRPRQLGAHPRGVNCNSSFTRQRSLRRSEGIVTAWRPRSIPQRSAALLRKSTRYQSTPCTTTDSQPRNEGSAVASQWVRCHPPVGDHRRFADRLRPALRGQQPASILPGGPAIGRHDEVRRRCTAFGAQAPQEENQ